MAQSGPEFSRIRSFLWPINRCELVKFVPMLVLFFLIAVNYHLLRIAKDALIITAPQSGAEVIPFLKVWGVLPSAVIMTFIFTRLGNVFNREKIFYVISTGFIIFFIFFIFLIYPNRQNLFLHSFADHMQAILPPGFKGFIAIIRYWIYSIFYIMAESWSTLMLSILVWGFANDVTSVPEAKRFYALFGIGINSSGIIAGQFGSHLSKHAVNNPNAVISWPFNFFGCKSSWDQTFFIFMITVIVAAIVSQVIYRILHLYVFKNRNFTPTEKTSEPKPKMSLRKTLYYVVKSKYLISLVFIVLAYNISINFTEILWKSQVKELYPSTSAYTAYMSKITFYVGILATFGSYFISGNLLRRFGWRFTAFITPCVILSCGIFFFYFLFIRQLAPNISMATTILGMSPLMLTVFFGSMQNVFARSAKYTVFDDTKEMAFIPLSPESRLKGKAAIDGIVSRLGKSGSSLVLQILLMFLATPMACSPIIAICLATILPVWMVSINSLGRKFNTITTDQAKKASITKEATGSITA